LIRDWVIPGYFEAMRIPLVRGRFLEESDLHPNAARVAIINEEMARRFWPGEDPIGRRLKNGNRPWETVVGVVGDMRRRQLDEPAIPSLFEPGTSDRMDIAVRTTGDPLEMRAAIRAALVSVEPSAPPYGIVGGEQRLDQTVSVRALQMVLATGLAGVALILAVAGVYAIVHYSVISRTGEIGLRMAIGASRFAVLRMIVMNIGGLAILGVGAGLAGFLAVGRLISSFLFETSPLDPVTLACVPLLLLAVAALACLGPVRHALRIDPISALRAD
jgi:hypothetical protein